MKRLAGTIVAVVLVAVAGCNTTGRQPQFTKAAIAPNELKPGDTAVITVDLKDRHDIVASLEGVVREDPTIKLKLRPAESARKSGLKPNEWTLQVDVPFQAPPGNFTLDISAYRADGSPVVVKGAEGKALPLMVTVPVVIKTP
jgi:hypothetical protein